jgi:hypothetical protein
MDSVSTSLPSVRSRCDGCWKRRPQISPLRSFGAPVEMTKGRVVVDRCDGCWKRRPQISPLRSFGAPVEMTKGRSWWTAATVAGKEDRRSLHYAPPGFQAASIADVQLQFAHAPLLRPMTTRFMCRSSTDRAGCVSSNEGQRRAGIVISI